MLLNTQSGGVCVNDCLMHQAGKFTIIIKSDKSKLIKFSHIEYSIPFGGVGGSGIGNYHGSKSFSTFTHERSMLIKKQKMESTNKAVRYPPYNQRKLNILRFVLVKHSLLVKLKAYKGPIKLLVVLFAILAFYLKK